MQGDTPELGAGEVGGMELGIRQLDAYEARPAEVIPREVSHGRTVAGHRQ
jgi:hypothetical protein